MRKYFIFPLVKLDTDSNEKNIKTKYDFSRKTKNAPASSLTNGERYPKYKIRISSTIRSKSIIVKSLFVILGLFGCLWINANERKNKNPIIFIADGLSVITTMEIGIMRTMKKSKRHLPRVIDERGFQRIQCNQGNVSTYLKPCNCNVRK